MCKERDCHAHTPTRSKQALWTLELEPFPTPTGDELMFFGDNELLVRAWALAHQDVVEARCSGDVFGLLHQSRSEERRREFRRCATSIKAPVDLAVAVALPPVV